MRTGILAGLIITAVALAGHGRAEADVDGAKPGVWTMDLEAAKKIASEKSLPILLNFSGSDWCGWCKLMEENVFSKPEWVAYATNNIMMVLVDFPQDKSLVPEKYAARNEALSSQYNIEGFPSFVILDEDGATELGRLGAGREKTPESFKAELAVLLRSRAAEIARYAESLTPEKKTEFTTLMSRLETAKKTAREQEEIIVAASDRLEELQTTITACEEEILMFRIAQMGEGKLAEYKELKAQLDAANKKLEDWINTQPERTDENMKLFEEMRSEIMQLEQALSGF